MLKEELSPLHEKPPSDRGPKASDRLLVWCFLASVLINIGFALWLSRADIYGTQRVVNIERTPKIHVYKPPIKRKLPPRLKLPKEIIPPKMPQQSVHVRHQVQSKPLQHPAKPQSPPPIGTYSKSPKAFPIKGPALTEPREAAKLVSGTSTLKPTEKDLPPPQEQQAPPPIKPTPTSEMPKPVTTLAPLVVVNRKPFPPEGPDQKPGLEESSIDQPVISDIDPPPTSPCVVSFEIDEKGHVSGAHIKKHSDSTEFDQRCLDAIHHARGTPGIQNGDFYRQPVEWTFRI